MFGANTPQILTARYFQDTTLDLFKLQYKFITYFLEQLIQLHNTGMQGVHFLPLCAEDSRTIDGTVEALYDFMVEIFYLLF